MFESVEDTTITIEEKEIYEKIEIASIPRKFLLQKSFGNKDKEFISKLPDTELKIQIANNHFIIQKHDIPNLSNDFLEISIFQKITFYSITEEASIFEITFGVPDTDNIVFIYLTIDSMMNKSFKIEYPEWEED